MLTNSTDLSEFFAPWLTLASRDRFILDRRAAGQTLQEIGESLGCSRENIRILEKKSRSQLSSILDFLRSEFTFEDSEWALPIEEYLGKLKGWPNDLLELVPNLLGHITFSIVSETWVVLQVPESVKALSKSLPLTELEISDIHVGTLTESRFLLISKLIDAEYVKGLGIVRKSAVQRDSAFLILVLRGSQQNENVLAEALNISVRNFRAQIDRDERFLRNFALGEVGLSSWNLPTFRIKTAKDALVFILKNEGPQANVALIRKAIQLYPRTYSRYTQVLEDPDFGLLPNGLVGLTRDGARKPPEIEPKGHDSVIEYSERFFSTLVDVNADLLRGAGVPVHRRLGWLAGARRVGESKRFQAPNGKEVTIKRFPGNVSMGSLREMALDLHLSLGCHFELAFDLEDDRCEARALCSCHKS
jgi:DNA-binding CsgD family transcriptional regulator